VTKKEIIASKRKEVVVSKIFGELIKFLYPILVAGEVTTEDNRLPGIRMN
jgi:hypothetical protein